MTTTVPRAVVETTSDDPTMVVALVTYRGVTAEECHVVRSVFGLLEGASVVSVGSMPGAVAAPRVVQFVDAAYMSVPRADVVVVPGGLGCRELAEDRDLRVWLRAVAPGCRWIVGVSTGTVALAAAGIARDHPAVTHWLATGLLTEYGGDRAAGRVCFDGKVVTCAGATDVREAALRIVELERGAETADRVRRQLATPPVEGTPGHRPWWLRWFRR